MTTSRDYLYGEHPPHELHAWARSLRHVRYCRALGGHASDSDTFRVNLAAADRDTLVRVMQALGAPLRPVAPDAPRSELGRGYTIQELRTHARPIDIAPELTTPNELEIAGASVGVWIGQGRIELTIYPDAATWRLSDADLAVARRLDEIITTAQLTALDPPLADDHCVCPQYHPHIWTEAP